ncbi:hypothetical protein STEG23_005061, partial [Scotinomys teguina]
RPSRDDSQAGQNKIQQDNTEALIARLDKATQRRKRVSRVGKESEIHLFLFLGVPQKHLANSHNIDRGPGADPC